MKTALLSIVFVLSALVSAAQTPDSWSQKANFAGTAKARAVAFVVNGKAYYVTGYPYSNQLWEYNPATAGWAQKANYPGQSYLEAVSFSIGNNGYVLLGNDAGFNTYVSLWQYNPAGNAWTQKADFPGTVSKSEYGFSIGTDGYVVIFSGSSKETWKYNSLTNSWTQKANFPGSERTGGALALSINGKGYLGLGYESNSSVYLNDFWEYDAQANSWLQKANYGGVNISAACGFDIGTKGYVGTGVSGPSSGNYKTDFYEYSPATNSWTQIANYPLAVGGASGFSIGSKGYVVGGVPFNGTATNALWEYTPATTTGIDDIEDKAPISIYPNPVSEMLHINAAASPAIVQIYNLQGALIKQTDASFKSDIDLQQLASGIYMVKVTSGNSKSFHKIVKQ